MMKNFRILSLVLLLSLLLSCFSACEWFTGSETATTTKPIEELKWVDYVSEVKLDLTSDRLRQEATVHQFVDGDTTHFNVPKSIADNGVLKARYLAINTPESTGAIEEWGKAASKFTRSKLENAVSIILESDTSSWNLDSTGARHLVWVWYKTSDDADYRNLNLEILQEGLAIASNSANNTYGTHCMAAIDQARAHQLYVYSNAKDPDFYYGEAIQVSIKELAINPEKYLNKTVACEGVVTYDDDGSIFVEEYDDVTGMYFGVTCFKGYNLPGKGLEIITVGNRVKIVGSLQYWEGGGIYQISDLSYRIMKPNDPDNIQLISTGHSPSYTLTDPATFCNGKVTVTLFDEEGNDVEKEFSYAQLALNTTIEMHDLYVSRVYTTNNGGNSDGAMTLTCTYKDDASGKTYTIEVRTSVLYDASGNKVVESYFYGKTIDVKGLVDSYNGAYQIALLSLNDVVVK
jgi:endonuclease YncB( thermonuclease family)